MRGITNISGPATRLWRVSLPAVLMAMMAATAFAAPSFRGYTGLVLIPTARVLDVGDYDFGVTSEDREGSQLNNIFVTFSPKKNLELGANAFRAPGSDSRKLLVNAKYQLASETEEAASIAIGIIDLCNEIDATPYAVASKSIVRHARLFKNQRFSIRGHAGIGFGDMDALFVGLAAYAGNRIMLSVEWDSHDVNFGFRFTPVKGLRLHTAILGSSDTDHVGLGISYTKRY